MIQQTSLRQHHQAWNEWIHITGQMYLVTEFHNVESDIPGYEV